jgi:hypothetical protein
MCRPVFLFVATALRARASGCPCGGALELGPKRLGKIERTTEPRCDGAADYPPAVGLAVGSDRRDVDFGWQLEGIEVRRDPIPFRARVRGEKFRCVGHGCRHWPRLTDGNTLGKLACGFEPLLMKRSACR